MRLVSYNIRFGGGGRIAFLGAVLASLDPDVVLLQEATDPVAVDRIAHAAGLPHVYRRPGWSVAAAPRGPARPSPAAGGGAPPPPRASRSSATSGTGPAAASGSSRSCPPVS